MNLKKKLKAVVAAVGSILFVIVGTLPTDSPWKDLILAVLAVGTTYGVWRVPYLPAPVEPVNETNFHV